MRRVGEKGEYIPEGGVDREAAPLGGAERPERATGSPAGPPEQAPTRATVENKMRAGEPVSDDEYNVWLKPHGEKIGGWEAVTPPTDPFMNKLAPGDFMIRPGGKGDQNYFGKNDRVYSGSSYDRPTKVPGRLGKQYETDIDAFRGPERPPMQEPRGTGKRSELEPEGKVAEFAPEDKVVTAVSALLGEEKRREEEEWSEEFAAAGGLIRGFANGGLVGGFTSAAASAQGFTGGTSVQTAVGSHSALGFHQLDLRTDVGDIPVAVSGNAIEAIQRSALSGKLSQTGPRPSWYS